MRTYPTINGDVTKDWSDADRAAFQEAAAQLENITVALATSEEIDRVAAASPAAMIEEMRRQVAEKRSGLARVDRERIDKAALVEAEQKHGKDRVAVVGTRSGDIIVRCPTAREVDEVSARASANGLPDLDRERIARGAIRALVVHPAPAEFDERVALYPAIWGRLRVAVDALATGEREATEKKG